jgi:hypothetical protein
MAKVIIGHGLNHLQGHSLSVSLCGAMINPSTPLEDGDCTCPDCAETLLRAIAGTTKKERKVWRTL